MKSEEEKVKTRLLQKNQEINLEELHISLTQKGTLTNNLKKSPKSHDVEYEDVPLPTTVKKGGSAPASHDDRPLPSKSEFYKVPEEELWYDQNVEEEIEEELQ